MNFGQLTEYPFNAQVWGAASDWVMIFVTALTAIYLIRTFKEQKRSNDISENRDRREVMPIFDVKLLHEGTGWNQSGLSIKAILSQNSAFFLEILKGELITNISEHTANYLKIGDVITFKVDLKRWNSIKKDDKELALFFLYKDVDGRDYTQPIWYLNGKLEIEPPQYSLKSNSESFPTSVLRFIKKHIKRIRKIDPPF